MVFELSNLLPALAVLAIGTTVCSSILGLAIRWLILSAVDRDRVNVGWGSDGTLTRLWTLSKQKAGSAGRLIRIYVLTAWATYILIPIAVGAIFIYVHSG